MLTILQKLGGCSEGTNVRGWIHSTTWDSQNSNFMNIAQRTHQLYNFSNLKRYFIYFNNLFYKTLLTIKFKTTAFFTTSLCFHSFFIFLFLHLLLSLLWSKPTNKLNSLSSQPSKPTPLATASEKKNQLPTSHNPLAR